jgi:hypothetical protein
METRTSRIMTALNAPLNCGLTVAISTTLYRLIQAFTGLLAGFVTVAMFDAHPNKVLLMFGCVSITTGWVVFNITFRVALEMALNMHFLHHDICPNSGDGNGSETATTETALSAAPGPSRPELPPASYGYL